MKHKWMVMLVVLVTTLVTAQEAVKQYDDLKAQAGAWATSRLWASLLNTSAPEEEPPAAPPAACSVKEMPGDHSRQTETLASDHVNDTVNLNSHERAAANQTLRIESDALEDKHHLDPNEATTETFEPVSEIALLTPQSSLEAEEGSQPHTRNEAPDTTTTDRDDAVDETSRVHAEQEAHSMSRILNLAVAEEISRGADAGSAPVHATRAAFDTRTQERAIRRAVKALQDSIERNKRIELRIIRRAAPVDSQSRTNVSLRAENSVGPQAADLPGMLPAQTDSPTAASLSADGACASEE